MGIALTEVGLVPLDVTRREVETARELDVLLTAHIGSVADPGWPHEIEILTRAGLLDARQVHVHCNACRQNELQLLADAGAAVSITPETELQMGMGFPITGKALAHGLRFGFGCDIVSNQSGDLLTQMRLALQVQRALDNHITVESGGMAEHLELDRAQGARDRDRGRRGRDRARLGGRHADSRQGRRPDPDPHRRAQLRAVERPRRRRRAARARM